MPSDTPVPEPTRDAYRFDPPDVLARKYPTLGAVPQYDPTTFSDTAGYPCAGTRPRMEDADAVAVNQAGLEHALNTAEEGDLVFVAPWAEIDLTGFHLQDVAAPNVTLASDRGPGSAGGLLYAPSSDYLKEENNRRVFRISQPGFRLTGLRFRGPQATHNDWQSYDVNRPMTGMVLDAPRCEVDNVVGRHWGHAPFSVGRTEYAKKAHVHHCDLVDNPQDALGYGVAVGHADLLIQYCYFDNNRHSIAGAGYEDCSYTARNNVFGPNGILHAIDMHGRRSEDGETCQAGRRVSVHHNEVLFTTDRTTGKPQEAVKFRGVPVKGAQVCFNRFHHPTERYSEQDPGTDGSAILVDLPEDDPTPRPETLGAAGIDVYGNFSGERDPEKELGPNMEG